MTKLCARTNLDCLIIDSRNIDENLFYSILNQFKQLDELKVLVNSTIH